MPDQSGVPERPRGDSRGRQAGGPVWWFPRRAARAAIERCYGVPYLRELSRREHHGMLLLERSGAVVRDDGGSALHWHVRPDRRHDV